jgi:hypothetical protein
MFDDHARTQMSGGNRHKFESSLLCWRWLRENWLRKIRVAREKLDAQK